MANLQYLGSGSLGNYTGYTRVQYNNNYDGSITIEKISGYKSGSTQNTYSARGTVYLRRASDGVELAHADLQNVNNAVCWGKNWNEYEWAGIHNWTIPNVENGVTYILTVGGSGVSNINNYSCGIVFDARKKFWNNINIVNPNGEETQNVGTMSVYTSEDGVSRDNLWDQPASFTYIEGSYFDIYNINIRQSNLAFNWVENATYIGNNTYRKYFDGGRTTIWTKYKDYTLDLNGQLDGSSTLGDLGTFGTASVKIDGSWAARHVNDYNATKSYNSDYSIEEIAATSGYRYNGLAAGSAPLSGKIEYGRTVILSFSTIEPSNLSITYQSSTNNSITVAVSADGLNINNYTLYYKKTNETDYSSLDLGTSTTGTITELDADSNYNIYLSATNPGGTTTTVNSPVTFSTTLPVPIINSVEISNLLPFSFTATIDAVVVPSRTLNYSFSLDAGETWTAYQASNSYDFDELAEETEYTLKVKVKALHEGTSGEDTETISSNIIVNTPADQAAAYIKIDGQWVKGKTWYKIDGQWVKAKKIYYKKDNAWHVNKNEPGGAI